MICTGSELDGERKLGRKPSVVLKLKAGDRGGNPRINQQRTNDRILNGLFENWSEKYFNFWVVGQIPELANWGGEQMLKRELLSEI